MQNDLDKSQSQSVQYSQSTQKVVIKNSLYGNQLGKIKPKYIQNLLEILTSFTDNIFGYLTLIDLSAARGINKLFQNIIDEYYHKRLKIEIQLITTFQSLNQEKTSTFMKNIDSQIPISTGNWLDFDLSSVTNTIQSLSKDTITQLRAIKNIGKYSDNIYAPFCIIFGYNKTNDPKVKSDGWKKTAGKILNDSNFFMKVSKLDLENFNDGEILEAFVALNLPELEINSLRRFSPALGKLIKWCQAVVSYHILIHPYAYRNDKSQILEGTEVYEFSQQMNRLINKFYKFKRFLYNLGIAKLPLGDYVFNLQHSRENQIKLIDYNSILTEDFLGNIFSYIPINQSHKLISVNKKFLNGFKRSLDKNILETLKEIFFFKQQAYEKLYKKLPMIYENNVFSKYFLMLDDILNSECSWNEEKINYIPFLTKEQLNDIKNLKIENDLTNSVAKVLCILLKVKTERKVNSRGEIENLYLKKLKQLAINKSLLKLMRSINKLDFSKTQLKTLSETILKFYSVSKLEEIKKINRGIYQLLIWELFIFEYVKEYNPFSLANIDLIISNSNIEFDEDDVEMTNYYIELMNFLKYNLKAKFHFYSLDLDSLSKMQSFEFPKLIKELYNQIEEQGIEPDILFESQNMDHSKISTVYFESKDLIPLTAKPALYERIMIEIISTTLSSQSPEGANTGSNGTQLNTENNLGTIKEENSLIQNNNINNNANIQNKPINSMIIASMNRNSNINENIFDVNSNTPGSLPTEKEGNYRTNFNKDSINFNMIPNDVIIKILLFFLDINTIPIFSLINKKCNLCIKTHIFMRIFFLDREKKNIEEENNEIITSIENKRNQFFNEYQIDSPNKSHACQLMGCITSDDILEIKQYYKKYNQTYENIIAPLVVLLGGKPKNGFNTDGSKKVSYFIPAQKMIYTKDFTKKIQNLELETIPFERFSNAEKLMKSNVFDKDKIKNFSPCLIHLIYWLMGVIEFHRVVRKYTVSYYDYDIFDNDEIKFCKEMDNITLLYFRLIRYANKYCKKYEKNAYTIMKNMNIYMEEDA